MKKLTNLVLSVMSLLPVLPALALAQDDEGEVIVIAELNRSEVNKFIEEVQAEFYAIYNANNDDDEFDIICYKATPTGSHISQEVCEPQFFFDARAENANNHYIGDDTLENDQALRAQHKSDFEELQRRMEAMTTSNAQFREIASILQQLRARLAQLTR